MPSEGVVAPNSRPGTLPGSERLPEAAALVAPELVLDRVDQRLPGGFDDVASDPDRPPGLLAVRRGDQDARLGRGAAGLVEDSHLVVDEVHLLEVRIEFLERLAERVVEGVDGAVP